MNKNDLVADALAKVSELGTVGAMKWLANNMHIVDKSVIDRWAFEKCVCAGDLDPDHCVYKRSDVVEMLKIILDKPSNNS